MNAKRLKKLPERPDPATVEMNAVHKLRELVQRAFPQGGRIKPNFAKAALTGSLGIVQEIAQNASLPTKTKIELLSKIYAAANRAVEELAKVPTDIPLWAERTEWRMSPCDFVKINFPTYGKGLSSGDIEDKQLTQALLNYKKRYGWPEDFDLPTKAQAMNRVIAEQGPDINLRGLAAEPPAVQRERVRIWKAQTRRLKK
ncbi:hypothetical protein [Phreatobacter stygius]|uniref:Uncharacterized protein n=1 Tax=Phreatobacter stygius TaxID=1940610 RepID=A0A4D7AZ65_9HYPH|nr:hypothetical protein [Phreatobacter stygius]QCI63948.1 hypothetical protein E8M01_06625 [Phreatobacter stygius]